MQLPSVCICVGANITKLALHEKIDDAVKKRCYHAEKCGMVMFVHAREVSQ